MKKIVSALAFVLAFFLASASWVGARDSAPLVLPEFKPLPHHVRATQVSTEILTRHHYKPTPLDDALSAEIFNDYLKALDSEKLFFVQRDIDQWAGARTRLDDALLAADLKLPFEMFNRYMQRASERFAYARSLLKKGFDFSAKESYAFSREKAGWAKSEAEMRELWRQRVKNDWLRLKLAGKDSKGIAETLDKRYEHSLKRISRTNADDAFQTFMNAYTMAIEPHTNYLGGRAAEDFGISMKLSLVGIGAVLSEKDDYTTIRELVPGGPAALSGQLKIGDRILAVAQGETGPMSDIVGWRVNEAVSLIRGPVDTVVRLDILPAEAGMNGAHKQVSLVRKKISLEEQAAKKSVVTLGKGADARRIGVLTLPTFYQDIEARSQGKSDYRSATRDVARLIDEMRNDKVDSLLIDLRNNGGGSLSEAIELTGLFIDKGPVVQQRDARGGITVARDTRPGVSWDGPLGVLINRHSASASEIFAAAIQDYGRGLVIGEQSFGKGTVQSLINLDQTVESMEGDQTLGDLKLTIAQFFRIDGGTTQLRGVLPDIPLALGVDSEPFGEASFGNALPWSQIKAAGYVPLADLKPLQPALLARHQERIKKDADYQDLLQDLAEFNAQRKKNTISLNEAERRKERQTQEAKQKAREARQTSARSGAAPIGKELASAKRNAYSDDGLQDGERNLAAELASEKARKSARDVILDEAVNILGDELDLLKSDARFVALGRPLLPLSPEPERPN